jgi:hypothetical protein
MCIESAVGDDFFEQSKFLQDAGGVRPEHHTRSHFLQTRSLFVNDRFNSDAAQSESRSDSTNTSANDSYVFRRHGRSAFVRLKLSDRKGMSNDGLRRLTPRASKKWWMERLKILASSTGHGVFRSKPLFEIADL